jgi:hypothetical protein
VRFINSRRNLRGLDAVREVGSYVLTHFFADDFKRFSRRAKSKPVSFRLLLARQDLAIKPATIRALVRVHKQLDELPSELAEGLSLSHHRALLPLPTSDLKVTLGQAAMAGCWTRDRLEQEVRKRLCSERSGRKPVHAVVRLAPKLRRLASALAEEALSSMHAGAVDDAMRGRVIAELEVAEQLLAKTLDRLRRPRP